MHVRWAVVGLLLLAAAPASANDADVSVGLGGIQIKREPRISMERERLTISLSKITVEYEFLNTSDRDITTEVGFPIPPYENTESAGGVRAFNDFHLWVDGRERNYETEAKAFLLRREEKTQKVIGQQDVTSLLQQYHLDIPSLGHYLDGSSYNTRTPDFQKLSAEEKKKLVELGLVDPRDDEAWPNWQVRKTYHWKQTFPAHKVLHVRHEYTPGFGFQFMGDGSFDSIESQRLLKEDSARGSTSTADELHLLQESCVDPALRTKISSAMTKMALLRGRMCQEMQSEEVGSTTF